MFLRIWAACGLLSSPPASVQPVVLIIYSVELTHACALCSSHEMCIPWGPPSCVLCWGEAGLNACPGQWHQHASGSTWLFRN